MCCSQYEVSDGELCNIQTSPLVPFPFPTHTQEACRSEMDTDTTWKVVPGNDLIKVSSNGEVQTWETKNRRWSPVFLPNASKQGYCYFVHQGKRHAVHQLVALAFHGPPPSSTHTVDHIAKYGDDVVKERSDNRSCNLRYATTYEQRANQKKHRNRTDSRGISIWKVGTAKSTSVTFVSVAVAANTLGLNNANLHAVASGKKKSIKGFHAEFEDSVNVNVPDDEEFRTVKGFEVSQYGRYRNSRSSQILVPRPGSGAVYATVGTNVMFHRLVAEAWPDIVGIQPSPLHNVDHIDRNVTNNNANNLRWSTQSGQLLNQDRKNSSDVSSVRKVPVDVSQHEGTWLTFESMHQAARFMSQKLGYKIKDSTVSRALSEKPSGYTFKRRSAKGWRVRLSCRSQ